jgi:hypothetical protein
MQALNRRLVALSPLVYFGQEFQRGDHFYATAVDADYFVTRKRAEDAPESFEVAPTPAPIAPPETADENPAAIGEATEAKNPSDGLTVAQIKAELTARGIEFPSGFVPKDKLAALLDGAADA